MIEEEKIVITVLHASCGRCGHRWDLKRGVVPKTCPQCHSRYWNAARKHKIHEPRPQGAAAASSGAQGAQTIQADPQGAAALLADGLAGLRRRG